MLEVTPKAFKISSLGQSPPAVTSTESEPNPDRRSTEPEPSLNQFETINTAKFTKFTISNTLTEIVSDSNGITANEANQVLKRLVKRRKVDSNTDLSLADTTSGNLRALVDKGILTRVKINKVYHYYLRVD